QAKVIGRDSKTDLALLKIEAKEPLPYVSWGDSNALQVGDWVLAVGNTFGLNGQVIGINTAIYSPNGGSVGIGFAIPAALAKPVIEQLKEHGKVERGWLGVQVQEVTPDIAKSLGLPKAE